MSDERLKVILGTFRAGLAAVLTLQPILHRWTTASGLDTTNIYAGFSAQQVMQFIPQAVGKGPDGWYSLSDRALVAAVVTAIKDLHEEVQQMRRDAGLMPDRHPIVAATNEEGIILPTVRHPRGDVLP